jgi:hypothetical protein
LIGDLTASKGLFMLNKLNRVVFIGSLFVLVFVSLADGAIAQKGRADADWYPQGYGGSIWTGEVTDFDDGKKTLTLTHTNGKKSETFVASIPDAPYQWVRDSYNSRVIDFAYDKKVPSQLWVYVGPGHAATVLPENTSPGAETGRQRRPNPPSSDDCVVLSEFMGRRITVYYTARDRKVNDVKEKYNDVWRIHVDPPKKK